ncbi:disulfide bond formation protein DsbA [Flavobacteriaceae bacterium R38]|nr:disulfide bond formation protein DsbA [Flavobacteriaceae bacterium R38]
MKENIIKIDVISDVACPWCYIGKRRMEQAIQQWKGRPVEVEWHPFQLDPTIPIQGFDRTTYMMNKFGDMERSQEMTDRITAVGLDEGIKFNFGDQWLAVNTLPLHQLLHIAGIEGFKDELKERFLKAYFDENLHLNKVEVLNDIMAEYGWSSEKTAEIIADDTIANQVKQEIAHYQKIGVSGVPFFIIDNQYGISGAQPPEVFLKAFASIAPLNQETTGDSCDLETGEC